MASYQSTDEPLRRSSEETISPTVRVMIAWVMSLPKETLTLLRHSIKHCDFHQVAKALLDDDDGVDHPIQDYEMISEAVETLSYSLREVSPIPSYHSSQEDETVEVPTTTSVNDAVEVRTSDNPATPRQSQNVVEERSTATEGCGPVPDADGF